MSAKNRDQHVNDAAASLASHWFQAASHGTRKQVLFQLDTLSTAALIVLGTELANVQVHGGSNDDIKNLLDGYYRGIIDYADELKKQHAKGQAHFAKFESDPSEH